MVRNKATKDDYIGSLDGSPGSLWKWFAKRYSWYLNRPLLCIRKNPKQLSGIKILTGIRQQINPGTASRTQILSSGISNQLKIDDKT